MKKSTFQFQLLALAVGSVCGAANTSWAATINAASCSQNAVQTAINASSTGDIIIIPDGSCGWSSGLSTISKGIHIKGATKHGTTITHNAGSATLFPLRENTINSIRISNLKLMQGTGGNGAWEGMFINVQPSTNGKPVFIDNNYFNFTSGSRIGTRFALNRGVIWSNEFYGNKNDAQALSVRITSENTSWTTADTMGTKDTNGNRNVYIENNTFSYFAAQTIDTDEGSRTVIRYNVFDHAPIASHGTDTGTYGARHFEIYNNDFRFVNLGDCSGAQTFNIPWYYYIRGGTGIIADNAVINLSSCAWGTPNEFNLQQQAVRRNAGINACYKGSYPMPYQIGMGHDGTKLVMDPIYVWGNTGTGANSSIIGTSNYSPSECGSDAKSTSDYVQLNRDYYYGVAKPGYVKYPYPHPLANQNSVIEPPTPEVTGLPALPKGNEGLAASYPNDTNISSHPNVLFADGFESYSKTSDLTSSGNWTSFYQSANTALDTTTYFDGTKAIRLRMPSTGNEVSNALVKNISPARDKLHVRACARFQATYAGINAAHNGIRITANYPGPGRIPNGTDFFLVNFEHDPSSEAEPGYHRVYVYHPEQDDNYGEHWFQDGTVVNGSQNFGPYFVPRTKTIPARDTWFCHELMVQANTPGQRDGRVAIWENGVLLADWQNLRFRDVDTVKINQIQLENGGQGSSQQNDKWYDNVVVATSYIGPMVSSVVTPLTAPTVRIVP